MARRARIHYPGAVYHVMLRWNVGQDIFFDEPDRIRFYDLLEEGVKRSIVCANVWKRIPVLRQNLREQENTRHKYKYVKPDPYFTKL